MKMTNLYVFIHEIFLKGQWKYVFGKLKTCMYVCTHPSNDTTQFASDLLSQINFTDF